MRYLIAELVCILVIAVGLGMWVAPGAGVFVAGLLGLLIAFAAQIPKAQPPGGDS